MYGRMFHAYRCYISIASINSNRRGWSRRIFFCKIPNDSKNFDTFFITPRSFLLFISNLHCLIKQFKNHAIVRKTLFLTIFAHFLQKWPKNPKFENLRFFVSLMRSQSQNNSFLGATVWEEFAKVRKNAPK